MEENKINAYKLAIFAMACQLKTILCLPKAMKVVISTSSFYLNVLSLRIPKLNLEKFENVLFIAIQSTHIFFVAIIRRIIAFCLQITATIAL